VGWLFRGEGPVLYETVAMMRLELVRRLLRCPACRRSEWRPAGAGFACPCGKTLRDDDGVLSFDASGGEDAVSSYYDAIGGLRFAGSEFAENPQIHLATRAYRRHLDDFFPEAKGALADLGCGDGRFSLWALERGFPAVLAVDQTLSSLQRLARAARERGFPALVPLRASFESDCFVPGAFQGVLAIESFTYLDGRYGAGLQVLRSLLGEGGAGVVAEFCRGGRALADVVAVNLENMRLIAEQGRRREKSASRSLVQRLFDVEELVEECRKAGLEVLDRRGLSPVPMLFHYAWSFTSYPLRPPLDAEMQALLEHLDDQTSAPGQLSRNAVLLVRKR
jgi:SAM-dependent methyltransferase